MIAVDSSVAIAAFGEWHELNTAASAILDEDAAIPAHALLETYSVLTGFPPPYRATPSLVSEWLNDRFSAILSSPTASQHRNLVSNLAQANHAGGSVYDALVGLTARLSDATLITADIRATHIYQLIGVDYQPLA